MQGASLLAQGCSSVALLGDHPTEVVQQAFSFGQELGLAHQVSTPRLGELIGWAGEQGTLAA